MDEEDWKDPLDDEWDEYEEDYDDYEEDDDYYQIDEDDYPYLEDDDDEGGSFDDDLDDGIDEVSQEVRNHYEAMVRIILGSHYYFIRAELESGLENDWLKVNFILSIAQFS